MTCCPRLRPQPNAIGLQRTRSGSAQARPHARATGRRCGRAAPCGPYRPLAVGIARSSTDPPHSPPPAPLGTGASTMRSVKNRAISYVRPPGQPEPGTSRRTTRRRVQNGSHIRDYKPSAFSRRPSSSSDLKWASASRHPSSPGGSTVIASSKSWCWKQPSVNTASPTSPMPA